MVKTQKMVAKLVRKNSTNEGPTNNTSPYFRTNFLSGVKTTFFYLIFKTVQNLEAILLNNKDLAVRLFHFLQIVFRGNLKIGSLNGYESRMNIFI